MKKLISLICVLTFLLSSITVSASTSNYAIELDKTIYKPRDYLVATISVPNDGLPYVVEILKGHTLIYVMQKKADDNKLRIHIPPLLWEAGDDYILRAGRGKDISTVNFEVIDPEYIITSDKELTASQGDTITISGTTNIKNATEVYYIHYYDEGFTDIIREFTIKDNKFSFSVKIDNTFKSGLYRITIGESFPLNSKMVLLHVKESTVQKPTVQKPTASPSAGQVESGTKITISSTTEGATIYYTTDGSTPTRESKTYTGAISITAATTIKAFAVKENYADSNILEQKYTIKTENTPPPSSGGGGGGGGGVTLVYTISFETNRGSSVTGQAITENKKVTKPYDPTKKGFIFTGWFTDSNLTAKYDFDTKVTKAFTLYAGWEKEIVEEQTPVEDQVPVEIPLAITTPFLPEESLLKFNDIEGHWAEDIIIEISERGISGGYPDGTFKPDNAITRAEFMKMAVDALKFEMTGEPKVFDDVKKDDWFKKYIDIGTSNELAQGVSEALFAPNANISRQDLCVIMYNALIGLGTEIQQTENIEFSDSESIANYAKDAINILKQLAILGGRSDNSFDPDAPATRAEAAKIILGIIDFIDIQVGRG